MEVASRGVTVNAVAPGFIATDMTEALTEDQTKVMLDRIPLGRMGEASDVAATVSFYVLSLRATSQDRPCKLMVVCYLGNLGPENNRRKINGIMSGYDVEKCLGLRGIVRLNWVLGSIECRSLRAQHY